jgi:flagellin|tara:strand:+ start:1108 stop:1944 length:837 start_codon:yes stop_codon:yes gene_type:complete
MALAIATNNAALNAAASASSVNKDMETSMARLSSGKRINSASDDAAGVAISSRLSAEIRGTDQAIRNSLDGQALIDTAEGAHKEIENILQRMREVGIQSANDTNNNQDRTNLQAELDAMIVEIDRIAGTTTWAGANLMDATTTAFSFQVGAATGAKNQISVTLNQMNATGLGVQKAAIDIETDLISRLAAVHEIDHAIEAVNIQRSKLGAVSNRLNHTVNNLTNISSNLSAAKGGIEDADFALETTNLAKNQILQQASTAMLAQANASKQNVLSLLQG